MSPAIPTTLTSYIALLLSSSSCQQVRGTTNIYIGLGSEERPTPSFGPPKEVFKKGSASQNPIYVADGTKWNAPSSKKPDYVKADAANIQRLARHVDLFLALIPLDSSTFDVQSMFKKLVNNVFHARSVIF